MKRCNHCNLKKDPADFYKNKSRKDGLHHTCKACVKEQMRIRTLSGKSALAQRAMRRRNRERFNFNPYALKDKKICSCCKQVLDRVAFGLDKNRGDGLSNKCKVCTSIRDNLKRSVIGAFTLIDLLKKFKKQDRKCYYCKKDLLSFYDGEWHIDHFHPIARGGTNWSDNIVCACPECNLSKGDRLYPSEWQPLTVYENSAIVE